MKYQAINNYIIVKKETRSVTAGGIHIAAAVESAVTDFDVIGTTDLTKVLQDKTIYCARSHVQELGTEGDVKYGAVKAENVIAVKQ